MNPGSGYDIAAQPSLWVGLQAALLVIAVLLIVGVSLSSLGAFVWRRTGEWSLALVALLVIGPLFLGGVAIATTSLPTVAQTPTTTAVAALILGYRVWHLNRPQSAAANQVNHPTPSPHTEVQR